jgi:hypothetical protein
MRSAPALRIRMTPLSSVAMLEMTALFRMAFCNRGRAARVAAAPVLDNDVRHKGAASHAAIRSAVRWSA